MRRPVHAFTLSAFLCVAMAPPTESLAKTPKLKWRKVLSFNVLDTARNHKADIGNHKIVIAEWDDPLGWDINVYEYPVTSQSRNLLADGHNWHGIQPWMALAWTTRRHFYPDERILVYNHGKCKLKIVLVNCKTKRAGNWDVFSRGWIRVYHYP